MLLHNLIRPSMKKFILVEGVVEDSPQGAKRLVFYSLSVLIESYPIFGNFWSGMNLGSNDLRDVVNIRILKFTTNSCVQTNSALLKTFIK